MGRRIGIDGRLGGKHKTVNRDLMRPLARVQNAPGVKRVILSFFHPCRHSFAPGTLRKGGEVPGGIRLKAYAGGGYQEVVVITDNPKELERLCA